jgi:hypothetical protein
MSPRKLKAELLDDVVIRDEDSWGAGAFLDDHGSFVHRNVRLYRSKIYNSLETTILIGDGGKSVMFFLRAEGEKPTEILESARASERKLSLLIRELQAIHSQFAEKAATLAIEAGGDS